MTEFRRVTDDLSVSPQIRVEDIEKAARQGFKTIINNRPDGEEASQPSGHEIEAAAKASGLAYFHIPVTGAPTPQQVETTQQVLAQADAPVLAYCRSGTRSIVTWSLSEVTSGARDRGELVQLGRQAGYDLTGVLGG